MPSDISSSLNNIGNASGLFAIVLAAGASTRMGTCKAGLPWIHNQTLLAYQASQLLQSGFTPVIVLGPHNRDCQRECPAQSWIVINPDPSRGKTSSILAGLQVVPQRFTALAISAVDQPRSSAIYQTLLQAHHRSQALITAPTYHDRLGHPLLFSLAMRSHLEAIREDTQGLRQVMQTFHTAIQRVEFDTSIVVSDLNTPERYQAAYSRAHLMVGGPY